MNRGRSRARRIITAAAAIGVAAVYAVLGIRWFWPDPQHTTTLESIHIDAPTTNQRSTLPTESSEGLPTVEDLTRRLAERGWLISTGAYAGLPDAILRRDLARLASATERIGGTYAIERDNFALPSPSEPRGDPGTPSWEHFAGPDADIDAVPTGSGPVPMKLLPAPGAIGSAFRWPDSHDAADLSAPFEDLIVAADGVGRSILYAPGFTSHRRVRGPQTQPGVGWINGRYFGDKPLCKTDRAVYCGIGSADRLAKTEQMLNRTAPFGGHLDVRLKTVALNQSVYLMQVEPAAGEPRRVLVFPIADGWPPNLAIANANSQRGPSTVAATRELIEHTSRGRSLLLVPRPAEKIRPLSPDRDEHLPFRDETLIEPRPFPTVPLWNKLSSRQERVALPGIWAEAAPVISIRKARDWAPFGERYIIEKGIDKQAAAAGDIRLIVLFGSATEEDIETLVRAAQHGSSGP